MEYYLFVTWGDVSPEILGPFATEAERDAKAKELRKDDPAMKNGIFMLNHAPMGDGLTAHSYSNKFFEED
jgi:hypothetical protein